jgi:hypothetical protein
MAKTFEKIELENETYYDVYKIYEDGVLIGGYFTPEGVTAEQYDAGLTSAKAKLSALGFTEIEVTAILGRQIF